MVKVSKAANQIVKLLNDPLTTPRQVLQIADMVQKNVKVQKALGRRLIGVLSDYSGSEPDPIKLAKKQKNCSFRFAGRD